MEEGKGDGGGEGGGRGEEVAKRVEVTLTIGTER